VRKTDDCTPPSSLPGPGSPAGPFLPSIFSLFLPPSTFLCVVRPKRPFIPFRTPPSHPQLLFPLRQGCAGPRHAQASSTATPQGRAVLQGAGRTPRSPALPCPARPGRPDRRGTSYGPSLLCKCAGRCWSGWGRAGRGDPPATAVAPPAATQNKTQHSACQKLRVSLPFSEARGTLRT
jgi:hypothetical protein